MAESTKANGVYVKSARSSSFLLILIPLVMWTAGIVAAASAAEGRMPWHHPEWKFRQVVKLLTPDPGGTINTGLIELEASPPLVAEDGKDIRVVDENGRVVKFEVLPGKSENAGDAPPPGERSHLRLHFEVTDPKVLHYVVYFGNPKAQTLTAATWEKKIGGLTLETQVNALRRVAANFRQMKRLIATSKWRYGKGLRRQINDPENPYGPNENYISIYRGIIYCPVEGTYAFGTDSDDSSFLLINGSIVVQWPAGHNPLGRFDHFGLVPLSAGMHRIEYYHVQTGGASLARAGWRPPGADGFVTIPEDAFVKESPTKTVAVEEHGVPFCAFFDHEMTDSLQFGNSGPVFAQVRFLDRSRSKMGKPAAWRWIFGDGTLARGPEPVHTFLGPGSYPVTLRCVDDLGYESNWTKTIRIGAEGKRRVDVTLEVTPEQPLLMPDEPLRMRVKCKRTGSGQLPLELITELTTRDSVVLGRERESLSLPSGEWYAGEFEPMHITRMAFSVGRVRFVLAYQSRPVAVRSIAVRRAADSNPDLTVQNDCLVDGDGTPVVLRLSGETYKRREPSLLQKLKRKSAVNLLFVDDSLAGAGEEGYIHLVKAIIEHEFPGVSVELTRVGLHGAQGGWSYRPYGGLMDIVAAVRKKRPDAVVVAGSLRDVIRFTPVARYERRIHALVEFLEGSCGAQVLLLTPPPTIANPALAKGYAIAVKRVGLRKRVPVADIYSAFMRAGEARSSDGARQDSPINGWEVFYRDTESDAPIYHLSPTTLGQRIIAIIVSRTLLCEPDSLTLHTTRHSG